MPTSTARADAVAGIKAVLVAYKAANPTLLRGVGNARPSGSAFEKPYAYIVVDEVVRQDSAIRTRTLSPKIVLLDTYTSSEETEDRMAVLIDGISDALTANPHMAGGNTVHQGGWTVQPGEEQFGEAIYRSETFALDAVTFAEGRL
jgi:hypothetical protein